MIEVFRTNVTNDAFASVLANKIEQQFPGYKVNFDLDDCDRILRIRSNVEVIHAAQVIEFVNEFGCTAEVLPDEEPAVQLLLQAKANERLASRQVSRSYCAIFSGLFN
jgi:hypothetical protein